jgi:molybdate transport system regulatory protein
MAKPPAAAASANRRAIRPRVYLDADLAIGPGKVDLLRQIDAMRSISAAARAMRMSYKRAWQLIDTLNRGFGAPVVATATGGRGGGGAMLTDLGRELVLRYAALEERLNAAAVPELSALQALRASARRRR